MALFILRQLILQPRMRRQPVGSDVVGLFAYFYTLCVRTAKPLARLRWSMINAYTTLYWFIKLSSYETTRRLYT